MYKRELINLVEDNLKYIVRQTITGAGKIDGLEYYYKGKLHRIDKPASINWRSNGKISYESYYVYGVLHRANGPAGISYSDKGKLYNVSYYQHGVYHRTDGPASVWYFKNTNVLELEFYFIEGKRHRLDGPAVIRYNSDSSIKEIEWYKDDIKLGITEIIQLERNIKFKELKITIPDETK